MKKFCADLGNYASDNQLTKKHKKTFKTKTLQHMFNEDGDYGRDQYHCHYTVKFSGVAHSICDMGYKTSNDIIWLFIMVAIMTITS